MRRNRQLVVDRGHGDCFRACLTSILGVPNSKRLPATTGASWLFSWSKLLRRLGLAIVYEDKSFWRDGLWIASVRSLNFENGRHAIVMRDQSVEFDPSPLKRYKRGSMLDRMAVVHGGTYIEVLDPAKLPRFLAWVARQNARDNIAASQTSTTTPRKTN